MVTCLWRTADLIQARWGLACNCTEAAAAAEPVKDTTIKSAAALLGCFREACVILALALSF